MVPVLTRNSCMAGGPSSLVLGIHTSSSVLLAAARYRPAVVNTVLIRASSRISLLVRADPAQVVWQCT